MHARQLVDGWDRRQLERLCRYITRPPLALERLSQREDGRYQLTLKSVWKDGTRALLFEPHDLLARLAAAIPPPSFHLTRYYGVLSSHSSRRGEVVPEPPADDGRFTPPPAAGDQLALPLTDGPSRGCNDAHCNHANCDRNNCDHANCDHANCDRANCHGACSRGSGSASRVGRRRWAWLLRHVFAVDVETCRLCNGPMRWLEVADHPEAIARLLYKHGLTPRAPSPPRPPAPPRGQLRLPFVR